jgi:uncharacterized membrane protein
MNVNNIKNLKKLISVNQRFSKLLESEVKLLKQQKLNCNFMKAVGMSCLLVGLGLLIGSMIVASFAIGTIAIGTVIPLLCEIGLVISFSGIGINIGTDISEYWILNSSKNNLEKYLKERNMQKF